MVLVSILYWGVWKVVGGLLVLAVVSVLALLVFMGQAKRIRPNSIAVADVRQKDSEVLSYIVTYLVPFLAVDKTKPEQAVAMVGLFILICLIYIQTSMLYVNPVLTILGYNLVEVTTDRKDTMMALTSRKLRPGDTANVSKMGESILLVHKLPSLP